MKHNQIRKVATISAALLFVSLLHQSIPAVEAERVAVANAQAPPVKKKR